MTKAKNNGAAAPDPATFDLDAFIDERRTLTRPVLFKRADDLVEQAAALEKMRERLQANPDVERSIDEPGLEQVQMMLDDLAQQWEARGTPVTVTEVTDRQMVKIRGQILRGLTDAQRKNLSEGRADGEAPDPDQPTLGDRILLRQIEMALVTPSLTADALWKIYCSSGTGEAAVNEIAAMVQEVSAVPDGPFSRGSSETPGTQPSAQN